VQFAKVTKGSIEVHFRDSKHLRHIVEETPLIRAKGRVYFVRNQTTQDGDEIVPTKGRLERNYFLNFFADGPLKAKGVIRHDLLFSIHLPRKSDFNDVVVKMKGGMSTGDLPAYADAFALTTTIETFDNQLFKIRTADAFQLLADRRQSRIDSPHCYPNAVYPLDWTKCRTF